MSLTDGEKLIFTLLADLHRHLGVDSSIDLDLAENAIAYGDMWALKDKYTGIFTPSEERDPGEIQFVHDSLSMWRILEESYANLSPADQAKVVAAPGAHGKPPRFDGFDGHTEYVSIAEKLINKLERYEEFAGRALDAHTPNTEVHERMLEEHQKRLPDLIGGLYEADDLIGIMNVRIHPERR